MYVGTHRPTHPLYITLTVLQCLCTACLRHSMYLHVQYSVHVRTCTLYIMCMSTYSTYIIRKTLHSHSRNTTGLRQIMLVYGGMHVRLASTMKSGRIHFPWTLWTHVRQVIRHVEVDSEMILFEWSSTLKNDLSLLLSLQCSILPLTGFVRHTAYGLCIWLYAWQSPWWAKCCIEVASQLLACLIVQEKSFYYCELMWSRMYTVYPTLVLEAGLSGEHLVYWEKTMIAQSSEPESWVVVAVDGASLQASR